LNPFSSRFVVCVLVSLLPFLIPWQLHNPYLATPLSIVSYQMATSSSDQNKCNVLSWLDHLQLSICDTGSSVGLNIFTKL